MKSCITGYHDKALAYQACYIQNKRVEIWILGMGSKKKKVAQRSDEREGVYWRRTTQCQTNR